MGFSKISGDAWPTTSGQSKDDGTYTARRGYGIRQLGDQPYIRRNCRQPRALQPPAGPATAINHSPLSSTTANHDTRGDHQTQASPALAAAVPRRRVARLDRGRTHQPRALFRDPPTMDGDVGLWCFGVSPAQEASCSGRRKRPMPPMSVITGAETGSRSHRADQRRFIPWPLGGVRCGVVGGSRPPVGY